MVEQPFGSAAPSVVDALVWPAETAGWLARCPVGPDAVPAFAALDPDGLSHAACIDLLVAAGRLQAWLAACEQRVLGALFEHGHNAGPFSEKRYVREEVAAALRLSGHHASRRLSVAFALETVLTATAEALAEGRISYLHAMVIATETEPLAGAVDARQQVEADVLQRAERLTVGELRQVVRRAVISADPSGAEARNHRAHRDRRVTLRPERDGMAALWALLPAEQAQALMAALTAMARRDAGIPDADGNPRTLDQRRADALVQLGHAALSDPSAPTNQGARPRIMVAVALSTLVGCDEQPGQLDGYGAIPPDTARRMAADPSATWQRIVVDEVGRCLDYGRTIYRPPANLRDFVIARDRRCRFPGVRREALVDRVEVRDLRRSSVAAVL